MAKLTYGYPLITRLYGRSGNLRITQPGRAAAQLQQAGPRPAPAAADTRAQRLDHAWNHPTGRDRFVVSPFCHLDYGTFWRTCDLYYTTNIDYFRKVWTPLIAAPCKSAYDCWMKESLVHFYRCLDRSKYPPVRPGRAVSKLERHDVFSPPDTPPADWCGYPYDIQNFGLHHAHVEIRLVYYYGPMPPEEEPPPPYVRIDLGYESRLVADAFFHYNPHPKYFDDVDHAEARMGFAVLEVYDLESPPNLYAGTGIHSIRPYVDGAALTAQIPAVYQVLYYPPIRSADQRVSQNELDPDREVRVYWIRPGKPWNSHPQILGKPRGWFSDNSQPWGPNIQYGDYYRYGYHLPHEFCFYEEI